MATIVALSQENLVGRIATSMGEILASEWEQTREETLRAGAGLRRSADLPAQNHSVQAFEEFAQAKRDQYARRSVR